MIIIYLLNRPNIHMAIVDIHMQGDLISLNIRMLDIVQYFHVISKMHCSNLFRHNIHRCKYTYNIIIILLIAGYTWSNIFKTIS